MENIKTYNTFNNEINETLFFNKFDKIQRKIKKDLGINLYFSATFGTSITALFPFFYTLVKTGKFENTISETDIVLLVFCGLSILIKENKENIEKLKNAIDERGLTYLIDNVKNTLKNIFNLFTKICKILGKTIAGLIDMFAYTALFVPFIIGLTDVINLYKINFDNFNNIMTNPKGIIISTSIGFITITLKHIVNIVVKKIFRKSKNKKIPLQNNDIVQSFESIEIICENYFLDI